MRRPLPALVALGANLGQPRQAMAAALQAMAGWPGSRLQAVSGLYASAPVDAQGPEFLNAVALLHTPLASHELLAQLQALEQAAGRERPYRHAPRTLDLDLLALGDLRLDTPTLTLPHPRLHQRLFVLLPLLELLPDWQVPGLGAAREHAATLAGQQALRRLADDPQPWWH